ncbi:M28 family peptidase [bacterium]|nr:MAG: M28 family peptidase [bacterium]
MTAMLLTAGGAFGFDQDRAFMLLEAQCAFGPRNPNSEGHEMCLRFLERELGYWTEAVELEPFTYVSKNTGEELHLTNIIGRINPDARDRVILGAHWDTRPMADQDPNPDNRNTPILGANDGASGVAILLEVARQLYMNPVDFGVDIVLFDGEDYGEESVLDDYLIGSRYHARHLKSPLPRYGILLDLVGDRDLRIPMEPTSQTYAGAVLEKCFAAAERVNSKSFVRETGKPAYDDHIPFLEMQIPFVDLIDFDYTYWHTIEDVPKHCSAYSLGEVGRVVMEVLRSEKF